MPPKKSAKRIDEERKPLLSAATEPSSYTEQAGGSEASSTGGYQGSPGPSGQQAAPPSNESKLCRQLFLGMVIALPSVPCGISLAYSAVSLGSLDLTVDEASWFASATIMAYPVGSLLVGKLMDRYGRKPSLLSITVVSFMGWLLLSIPSHNVSFTRLMIGRILTGIAGGLASVPAAVYAAECLCPNDVQLRSTLTAGSTVGLSAGIFLLFLAGPFMANYNIASMATLISLLALVLVAIFIPESPAWLSSKGRHADAEWSERELNIVRLPEPLDEPSASEVDDIQPSPAHPPPQPEPPKTLQELSKPEVYKPLLIMIGFLFFQQFSGVYVVIAYMVDIIRAAGVVTVSSYRLGVLGGTIILLVALTATVVYPKTGVRSIAILSGLGSAITMFLIGLYLTTRPIWIGNSTWYFLHSLPIFLILSNIALSTAGFLILPWSMLGEIFPISVKGIAAGLATCAGFIFGVLALKLYPYIQLEFGAADVFYFFGSMSLLGTLFVIMYLPETNGKTLREILEGFSKKSPKPGSSSSRTKTDTVKAEVQV